MNQNLRFSFQVCLRLDNEKSNTLLNEKYNYHKLKKNLHLAISPIILSAKFHLELFCRHLQIETNTDDWLKCLVISAHRVNKKKMDVYSVREEICLES